jgi:hypothetical protein
MLGPPSLLFYPRFARLAAVPPKKGGQAPVLLELTGFSTPDIQAFTLVLALLAFRLFLAFRRSSLFFLLFSFVFVVRLAALATPYGALAPQAPELQTPQAQERPDVRPVSFFSNEKREALASFPLVLVLLLVFVVLFLAS